MKIINPSYIDNWDQMLLSSDNYSIFHSSMWQQVLSESYQYTPKYVCQIAEDKFQYLLPLIEISSYISGKRGVSLPFTDYCDPILNRNESIQKIPEQVIDMGKNSRWKYVELRSGKITIPQNQRSTFFYNHRLDLEKGTDYLFSRFNNNTKRNIKKAKQEGITIKMSRSLESLRLYYKLHCLTRKRHGIPPQSFYFFKKIHENLIEKDFGFILLASGNGRVIAGAVYLHFGDQALYKFGASDIKYKEYRANNLIMWYAIKWFTKNNFKNFDFGRTENNNPGLRRFKTGWGGREEVINYYKYDLINNCYLKDNRSINKPIKLFFGKMPIFANKISGNILYKHIG